MQPVAFPASEPPRPDRLRSEIVELWDDRLAVLLPRLEAGTVRVVAPAEAAFLRGDADFDQALSLADAVLTLRHVLRGDGMLECADAADVNDDGEVDIGDAVAMLQHLFLDAAAITPPSAAPGVDPTPDELRCLPGS